MITPLVILGIFTSVKTWTISGIVSIILGLGIVKKWTLIIDTWAKFVVKWTNTIYIAMQQGSKVILGVHDTVQLVDDAIAEDGSTNLNTLKEAFEMGKKVKVDLEDMIVIFKPKK